MAKTLIATVDTFTKAGRFIPRGAPLSADEVDYDKETSTNLTEAPKGTEAQKAVEISTIAPTGPNPTAPQQIAPGVVQTHEGYFDEGTKLVSEVTKPAKERFVQIVDDGDTTQGDNAEALAKADRENAKKAAAATTAAAKKAASK